MRLPKYRGFDFKVLLQGKRDKQRICSISTPHGDVITPAFVFCATRATLKGASPHTLREEKTQIILSNTYHLMLTPGPDVIYKNGGLQVFTAWHGPMLTDSGGYQIFSMGHGSVR
jgi:queuine tRNA-ribosyltransferase